MSLSVVMGVVRALMVVLVAGCRVGFDPVPMANCPLPTDFGEHGMVTATEATRYRETLMSGHVSRVTGTLAPEVDVVVELWDGYGVFAGGTAHVGTFDLVAAETSATTCGVCAYIVKATSAEPMMLLATDGTVDVTQFGPSGGTIALDVTAADFTQIDPATSMPVPSGCTTSLASASLSAVVDTGQDGVGLTAGHAGDGRGSGAGAGSN
jgi:hypothetical protein